MKNTLITLLILSNILTIVWANHAIKAGQERVDHQINELDRFYYGFCEETKEAGLGHGINYENLCGDL